jgi:hypothetical protein
MIIHHYLRNFGKSFVLGVFMMKAKIQLTMVNPFTIHHGKSIFHGKSQFHHGK